SVGVGEYVASGTPITRQVPIIILSNYRIRYLARNSEGRATLCSQPDLYVQHAFGISGDRALILNLNVLNLFDQRTVTNRVSTVARSGAIPHHPGYYHDAAV